jgi:hypothetical protein
VADDDVAFIGKMIVGEQLGANTYTSGFGDAFEGYDNVTSAGTTYGSDKLNVSAGATGAFIIHLPHRFDRRLRIAHEGGAIFHIYQCI